ncbi:MAG: hypothetical protein ACTHMS_11365 [Jatrophihabitans sp.]|uniref:hypothetical protein n=1 Tax=Jatrophihabitans sp. TaxID=1932789 RepID=UPI003F802436
MPTQLAPPSRVRTIEVQGPCEHGAVPSTHPSLGETKVTEVGVKPVGTGPPAGPLPRPPPDEDVDDTPPDGVGRLGLDADGPPDGTDEGAVVDDGDKLVGPPEPVPCSPDEQAPSARAATAATAPDASRAGPVDDLRIPA